ncbi:MAG TPA: hypothetical protein VJ879_13340 [Desulfobacter sp.]|nr:hypothetical protein [Desulfobacter sp.]
MHLRTNLDGTLIPVVDYVPYARLRDQELIIASCVVLFGNRMLFSRYLNGDSLISISVCLKRIQIFSGMISTREKQSNFSTLFPDF